LAATEAPASLKTSAQKSGSARKRSRHRGGVADVRYFVGRPAGDDSKPTLEQEIASELEALVIAFKNDNRVLEEIHIHSCDELDPWDHQSQQAAIVGQEKIDTGVCGAGQMDSVGR